MNIPARKNEPALQELPEGYDVSSQSLAVSLAIAEVDQQVTTARAYPRSIDGAMRNILSLATLDEQTAQECIYALPRGGKPIKGPSIRLAELIQNQWGNNRVGTRVVHVDRIEKYVEAEGVFHDLETNSATTARIRRRISDKQGRLFNDDMIIVTGNAASAIAKRNAILAGVPKAVWRRAYSAVENVLVGDIKTLVERRGEAMKAFATFGVTPEQIFAALEIEGLDDIGLDEMTSLIGMHSALKSGEATVEEMFPAVRKAGKPADLESRLDRLAEDPADGISSESSAGTRSPSSAAAEDGGGEGLQQSSAVADPSSESPAATQAAPRPVAGEGSGVAPLGPPEIPSPLPPDIATLRKVAIDAALQLASRTEFDADERQAQLDDLEKELASQIPAHPKFVRKVIDTAKAVVRKETPKAAAVKYLQALKDG
jgi:hypothetical protein